MTLAYMISTRQWTLASAYTHLKTIRPKVKPKQNFLRQLIQFQAQCDEKGKSKDIEGDTDKEVAEEQKGDEEKEGSGGNGKGNGHLNDHGDGDEDGNGSDGEEDEDLVVQKRKELEKNGTAETRKRKLDADEPIGRKDVADKSETTSEIEPAKKRMKVASGPEAPAEEDVSREKESRVFGMALPPHLIDQT